MSSSSIPSRAEPEGLAGEKRGRRQRIVQVLSEYGIDAESFGDLYPELLSRLVRASSPPLLAFNELLEEAGDELA